MQNALNVDANEVVKLFETTFDSLDRPDKEHLLLDKAKPGMPDELGVYDLLNGVDWRNLTESVIENDHSGAAGDFSYFLSPYAFAYYLPALCIYCLKKKADADRILINLLEALIFPADLSEEYQQFFLDFLAYLSDEQKSVVAKFLVVMETALHEEFKINRPAMALQSHWERYL